MNRTTTIDVTRRTPDRASGSVFLHPAAADCQARQSPPPGIFSAFVPGTVIWARVRQAAAVLALGYLVVGVALPWLLVDAPSLLYVLASVPAH